MPAISENFGSLLEPGLRKIFTEQYNELPEMRPMLFNVSSSDTSYEKDSSVGAFSDMPVFTGTIEYDEIVEGYPVTYTHAEFAKGFKVERKLFDDDLYGVIAKKPKGLAMSASRTQEKYAAQVFSGAFSGSGTISLNGTVILNNTEGLSLCNSAHTSKGISSTQSNTGTSALSATSVEATRILMSQFKDDKDNLISVQPDLILVPRALEETAWEIISSKGKVDSAENNSNFHFGKYKLAVWDYLADGSNWFMMDSAMAKMFLQWYDRTPLEFFQDKSFDTLISKFAAYSRFSFGFSDWRFVFGHKVA
jgi:phage major head subunit gpT-like protein